MVNDYREDKNNGRLMGEEGTNEGYSVEQGVFYGVEDTEQDIAVVQLDVEEDQQENILNVVEEESEHSNEVYDEEGSGTIEGVSDEEDSEEEDFKRRAEQLKEEMVKPDVVSTVNFAMLDNEGNYIHPRTENGGIRIEVLNIQDDIIKTRRVRTSDGELFGLQEQLLKFGQLQPIHVVMHGDKYLLMDGWRRLQALVNIGSSEVTAIVDETIPSEMVKYYEPIINGVTPYSFKEKIDYGNFFKKTQPNVSYETIEGILGLKMGEFLKGLYIDTMKPDFPDIYKQVNTGKLTIEQAFKKIEKEIEKREKEESQAMDDLNSGALDDQLRSTDELVGMQNEAKLQELGNRKILDPVLRRSVESRDGGYCQCCGYGKGEPDLMGVFNVHHIVAVQYGGHDVQSNLILLCNNCHTLVHDYEKGRFLPEKSTYDRLANVKKIVVLGNMLVLMRKKAIDILRRKFVETGRQMDAGKVTIGQALQKHSIDLGGEEYFNNSPYQTFLDSIEDLDYGGDVRGELAGITYEDTDNEEGNEVDPENN